MAARKQQLALSDALHCLSLLEKLYEAVEEAVFFILEADVGVPDLSVHREVLP